MKHIFKIKYFSYMASDGKVPRDTTMRSLIMIFECT